MSKSIIGSFQPDVVQARFSVAAICIFIGNPHLEMKYVQEVADVLASNLEDCEFGTENNLPITNYYFNECALNSIRADYSEEAIKAREAIALPESNGVIGCFQPDENDSNSALQVIFEVEDIRQFVNNSDLAMNFVQDIANMLAANLDNERLDLTRIVSVDRRNFNDSFEDMRLDLLADYSKKGNKL